MSMPSKRSPNLFSFTLKLFPMVILIALKGRNLKLPVKRINNSNIICDQKQWNRIKTSLTSDKLFVIKLKQWDSSQLPYGKFLVVKKVWQKGCCNGLAKKLWQMLTCITNRQSSINSIIKLNEAIPNID